MADTVEQGDSKYSNEPKQREFIQCSNLKMITKLTQMLDLVSRSGYDIQPVNIDP